MAAGRVSSPRVDGTAHGRIGMVSLSIYDEYVGQEDNCHHRSDGGANLR
jgi:hypothetical protein